MKDPHTPKAKLSPVEVINLENHVKFNDLFGYGASYLMNCLETFEKMPEVENEEMQDNYGFALDVLRTFKEELVHLQYGGFRIIKDHGYKLIHIGEDYCMIEDKDGNTYEVQKVVADLFNNEVEDEEEE